MKANKSMMAYIGAKPSGAKPDGAKPDGAKPDGNKEAIRDSDSWYTPSVYTDMVREVMGKIDLDPFSSKEANSHVKAKRYFDFKSNAFKQTWFKKPGKVFMNPPYGRKIINAAIAIFIEKWNRGTISEAIVLVNNATETKWFQLLLRSSNMICLPEKRIAFEAIDGKNVSGNTRGQVFLYFGSETSKFKDVFKEIGIILQPIKE